MEQNLKVLSERLVYFAKFLQDNHLQQTKFKFGVFSDYWPQMSQHQVDYIKKDQCFKEQKLRVD